MVTVSFAGGMGFYYGQQNDRGWGTPFKYCRIELRMKTMPRSGVITGFILISPDDTRASNQWCEWDIEIPGDRAYLEHTTHVYNNQTYPEGRQMCTGKFTPEYGSPSERFYTHAGEWTPEHITFEMDGFVYREMTNNGDGTVTDTRWSSPGEEISAEVYSVQKNSGPESLIDVWSRVDMMLGINAWHCQGEDWCDGWVGAYPGDDQGVAYFMNYFRFYSYTPREGADGSDWTIETDHEFDVSEPSVFNYFDGGELDLRTNDDGETFAVCSFGGDYTGELPEDDRKYVYGGSSKAYEPYLKMKRGSLWISSKGSNMIYGINKAADVSLAIHSLNGRTVRTLVNEHKSAGEYSITINKASFAAGTYILTLTASAARVSQRITLTGR
jgi:hypothetical protein